MSIFTVLLADVWQSDGYVRYNDAFDALEHIAQYGQNWMIVDRTQEVVMDAYTALALRYNLCDDEHTIEFCSDSNV